MWLRIAAVSDIGYVSGRPGAYYRVHESSMMRTTLKSVFADLEQRRNMSTWCWSKTRACPRD